MKDKQRRNQDMAGGNHQGAKRGSGQWKGGPAA